MTSRHLNVNITDDPYDWNQLDGDPDGWVHKYHEHLFSTDGGKTFYDVTMPLLPDGEALVFTSHPMQLTMAVGNAVGEASICWENISGAGVFDSEHASQVVDNLVAWINQNYEPKEH
jgi:hypothetical protein